MCIFEENTMAASHVSGPFISLNGFGTIIGTTTGATATSTQNTVVATSASLTTAAGFSATIVITNSNAKVGDQASATIVGGTNTTKGVAVRTAVTANTITVTLDNNNASAALNGTVSVLVSLVKKTEQTLTA
jgi:hypothetical protein